MRPAVSVGQEHRLLELVPWPVMMSARLVKPLFRSATVGTLTPDCVLPARAAVPRSHRKKKILFLMIGPPGSHSELILAQFASFDALVIFKPIGGIELVVAEKFPGRAVETVGAGLDGSVHDSAGGTTELGAEVRSLYLELRDRVHRRQNDKVGSVQEVDGVGIVVDAIQQVVVLRRAQTIGGKGAGWPHCRECPPGACSRRRPIAPER